MAWVLDVILSILVFVIDGAANITVTFLGILGVWLINTLNAGANEWMTYPVITNYFEMCRAIGFALFFAGVIYSVSENLMNYNSGNGLSSFQSTFLNIVKALIAV